jgi:hypothetical protein
VSILQKTNDQWVTQGFAKSALAVPIIANLRWDAQRTLTKELYFIVNIPQNIYVLARYEPSPGAVGEFTILCIFGGAPSPIPVEKAEVIPLRDFLVLVQKNLFVAR